MTTATNTILRPTISYMLRIKADGPGQNMVARFVGPFESPEDAQVWRRRIEEEYRKRLFGSTIELIHLQHPTETH